MVVSRTILDLLLVDSCFFPLIIFCPREAPQLTMVLKEMKEGLDKVKSKVKDLTAKVRETLN